MCSDFGAKQTKGRTVVDYNRFHRIVPWSISHSGAYLHRFSNDHFLDICIVSHCSNLEVKASAARAAAGDIDFCKFVAANSMKV